MSVIEFFTNYWDWYCLIGSAFAVSALVNDIEDNTFITHIFGSIVIILLWPVRLITFFETM